MLGFGRCPVQSTALQRSGKCVPQIMGEVKEIKVGFLNGKIKRAQVRDLREVYIYIYMERERERHGETSISRNWSQFFIFHGLLLYTEMLCKSHVGSAVLTFIKVRCFIQKYTEVLGVLHHLLAGGPADNLRPSPCDSGQSTRTLISPGVIILKTDATQIKLHSYRVRV